MDSDTDARSRSRRMPTIALAGMLGLALAGCGPTPSATPPPTPASGAYELDPSFAVIKDRVKVIVIDASGGAHPDPVKIKKNVDIVVWATGEGELHIDFPGESPFPTAMACTGRFCGLLLPAAKEGIYDYTASVTSGGATQTVDPRLEVVP